MQATTTVAGFTGRVMRGAGGTLMRQFINVFGQIVLLPVYLRSWGDQQYGEWQLLSAAVAYVALLDFGVQTYAVNRMNQSYARGEVKECTTILHTALAISLMVSAAALCLLAALVWAAPVERWFHLRETSAATARATLLVLGLQLATSLPSGIVGGVYRAVGEYARDVFFNNVQRALVLASTAILLMSGAGMLLIAAVQLAGLVGHVAFVQWDLRRRHPEIVMGISSRQRQLGLAFLVPSGLFLLMQLSAVFMVQGTTLLIGAFAGAAAVAAFSAMRALANVIAQIGQAIGATLWPELSAMQSRGEYGTLREIYMLSSKVLLSFALTAGVFLHFTAGHIVATWTSGRVTFDRSLMTALIVIQVCQAWYLASSVVLGSSNNHRWLALSALLATGIGLGAGAALASSRGAAGVMWGFALGELLVPCWLIPYRACRLAKQSLREYFTELPGKGAVVFALMYGVMTLVEMLPVSTSGLPRIAGAGLAVALSALVSLLVFWFTQEQRRRALSALRLPSW